LTFGDYDTADRIAKTKTPSAAVALGRSVAGYDGVVWRRDRAGIMKRGLWLKATQHASVRTALLETGDAVLGAASSTDAVWGIGLSAQDGANRAWPGQNLVGEAWMEVRKSLF